MLRTSFAALSLVALGALSATQAEATTVSPTGGALPAGVSAVGGVVFDALGLNGNRLTAQLAASSLFVGDVSGSGFVNIGEQSGFTAGILGGLGGGFSSVSVRISLFDGDNAAGDFDEDDNLLLVNGLNFGNFSDVATTTTDGVGTVFGTGFGFADSELDTGFFTVTDGGILASLFASLLSTGTLDYDLDKLDSSFQFYNFAQGIDSSLVNVGTGPVVTPPTNAVPLPAGGVLLLTALGAIGALRRRKAA